MVFLLIVSCKTTNTIETSTVKSTPETFSGKKDTTSSALINWQLFFEDTLLVALIDTALKNSPDILMVMQKIEIARSDMRLNKGAMFPLISGGAALSQRKFGRYTMDGAGNMTTEITPGQMVPVHLPDYFAGLQTAWEVDIWGKLKYKKKASIARYLKSVDGKNLVVTNLVTEIANTYYELLSLDNELDILRQTINLQQDAFNIITILKEAGIANEFAVKQFEAQVLNSQGLEFEVLQKITENENKLNFLSGRFPQNVLREKSKFFTQIPKQIQVGVPSDLLKNRPDIRQAEFELMASISDANSAKAAFYPSFIITGYLGYQAFNSSFLFTSPESMAYSVLGNLTAPLINRSAIKAQFKSAKAKQIEAMYHYQKIILNGYVEVSNELSNIKNLEQIHSLKTKEVDALTQSIQISGDLFKAGRVNYLEILLTQRNTLQSRLDLVNAKKRQYNAVINIYKALGGGWK